MSKRRKGRQRNSGYTKQHRFIVIAMEGAETEPRYFDEFKTEREDVLQIKLITNSSHKSRPTEVFQRLDTCFKSRYDKKRDEAWLVIDRDSWEESELNDVYQKCKKEGYHLALSNPCFELWLYLHLNDPCTFTDRHDCQRKLSNILKGYSPNSKGRYDVKALLSNIEIAIERARSQDTYKSESWPKQMATRVYLLVEKLIKKEI